MEPGPDPAGLSGSATLPRDGAQLAGTGANKPPKEREHQEGEHWACRHSGHFTYTDHVSQGGHHYPHFPRRKVGLQQSTDSAQEQIPRKQKIIRLLNTGFPVGAAAWVCRAWLPRDPAEDGHFPVRLRSFQKQPCPEDCAEPPGRLLQQDASAGRLSERTPQALSWVTLDRRGRAGQRWAHTGDPGLLATGSSSRCGRGEG